MQNGLFIAILTGLGGMLGWGIADFFAKKTIDKIGDVTTLFWGQLVGLIPLIILFFSFKHTFPVLTGFNWVYLIILGLWSGLSYIPTYVAFGKGKVSLLSPIFSSNAVLVAILSAAFFGEIIPFGRIISFIIVFAGIILINGNLKELWLSLRGKNASEKSIKGLPEILWATVLYAFWLVALDRFINTMDWVPVLLIIRTISAFILFVYSKATHRKIIFFDRSLWKYILLIGLFDVAAFGFVTYGFSATAYPSVVVMLSGAYSIPTIILGRIFLKEKSTKVQIIGSIAIIVGIMLLALL